MRSLLATKRVLVGVIACLLVAGLATVKPAEATVTYDLGTVFSGSTPGGTPPYLRISFADQAAGTVRVTFTALSLASSEFVSEWDFNLNPVFTSPTLAFGVVAGNQAVATHTVNIDKVKADGSKGLFDIGFNFQVSAGAGQLTNGESASFDITCSAGCGNPLDETDFAFLDDHGLFHSAAHIQGIPNAGGGGTCSGWVADGSGTTTGGGTPCGTTGGGLPTTGGGLPTTGGGIPVPGPTPFVLIGSALLGLGVVTRIGRSVRGK